jgi:DNA-binding XRE family transcriptional regulator
LTKRKPNTPIEKPKRGRPKTSVAEKLSQIPFDLKKVELLNSFHGSTDESLALILGVTEQTICNWKKDPEFILALKRGKDVADSRVVESLYTRATGYSHEAVKIFMPSGATAPIYAPYTEHYPPDPTSMIFWLKNRRKDEWRDQRDITSNGETINYQLTIGNGNHEED